METAPLKSFATWARAALIREVSARMAAVLAPASSERVEQAKAVAALEQAVAAAGGGDKGRAAVADKVAYIWFNRIIALRFMDANGYTGIGIVSPQAGVEVGQPEILAEAKRGVVDTKAVSQPTRTAVTGLLDGTRSSVDPQGEAYALLLADYCRHWNRAMPFMFEREGDFTELLIPANLLADDSVLNRSVKVLTDDVCNDVEVIGWLYQFYISERKDEVFAGFKKNKKAGADEIPAATQLFTPHWIVRYLVENSLGRLWMLNRPSSDLVDQMDYYIAPADEETDFLKITKPEELKVIDPACGSGHMLTYAFDLFYTIYEEEGYAPAEIPGLILTNNLYGTEIDPRAGALAAFALAMKARAKQRTLFTTQVEPNIRVIDPISFTPAELDFLITKGGDLHEETTFWNQFQRGDTFGSLIQPDPDITARLARHLMTLDDGGDMLKADTIKRARRVVLQAEYLSTRYHVVVANPPYMGSGNMNSALSVWLQDKYPAAKSDLFAAFFYRSLGLTFERGQLGFMSPFVWMFVATYRALRERFVNDESITSLIQLEYSGFDGATVPVCAFTLQKGHSEYEAGFVRLTDFVGPAQQGVRALEIIEAGLARERRTANRFPGMEQHFYRTSAARFGEFPTSAIAYWLPQSVRGLFASGSNLSSVAYTRIGLITGDNDAYIRQWFEVSARLIGAGMTRVQAKESGLRWFPISKGGEYRKWYGNATAVVDWQNDGRQLQTRLDATGSRVLAHNFNLDDIFREGVTWSKISSARFSGRHHPPGYIFNDPAASLFPSTSSVSILALLAYLSSNAADFLLRALNPTLNFQPGNVASLPWPPGLNIGKAEEIASEALDIARTDWNEAEISRDFCANPLTTDSTSELPLRELLAQLLQELGVRTARLAELEHQNNCLFAESLGLTALVHPVVDLKDVTLNTNADWTFAHVEDIAVRTRMLATRIVQDLVSYAVGCMFGRYSLDEPGLILADQGARLEDYLAKVPTPTFTPDADNVIPIVDGDWFEDDIVARFRQFLRAAFGEQHFEENLRFVTESLGVKDLRDYFVKSFYKDHVQRYKKRPIYWLFSSPKGSFNALIYMHRYTPSTVSTVLNEYLREFQAKLKASLEYAERSNNAKEADHLRKVLLELDEYEHDVLYPLASQNIAIDLDDGVKANYPKLGDALKKIPGSEANDD